MLLAAAITLLLLKNVGGAQNWRLFLATEGIIAFLFFLLRLSEPDSPHWLMTRGKFAEAAQGFIWIMPEQREAVLQLIPQSREEKSLANSVAQAKAPGLMILFSLPYRARTVLVPVPWFLMDIATYGVGLFTPIILGAIDISGRTDGLIAHDLAAARGSAAIDLFLLFGFLFGIWAVPRFGRIRMQVIGFGSMAVGMLILMTAVQLSNSSLHIPLVFAGFILFNLLMNAGPNATTWRVSQLGQTSPGVSSGDLRTQWRLRTSVRPSASSQANQNQSGTSKPSATICPRGRYFSQD